MFFRNSFIHFLVYWHKQNPLWMAVFIYLFMSFNRNRLCCIKDKLHQRVFFVLSPRTKVWCWKSARCPHSLRPLQQLGPHQFRSSLVFLRDFLRSDSLGRLFGGAFVRREWPNFTLQIGANRQRRTGGTERRKIRQGGPEKRLARKGPFVFLIWHTRCGYSSDGLLVIIAATGTELYDKHACLSPAWVCSRQRAEENSTGFSVSRLTWRRKNLSRVRAFSCAWGVCPQHVRAYVHARPA